MPKIVPIVEGDGEEKAVPKLLYKLLSEMERYDIQVAQPRNAHGSSNLLKAGGLEAFVQYAWMVEDCAAVLILMDADRGCPKTVAEDLSRRVQALGAYRTVVIVLAKCEYEAWFLASVETLAGKSGFPVNLTYPGDVETRPGAKEWLNKHLPKKHRYSETQDQVILTQWLDTGLARERSRSFRRLWHAVEEILGAVDSGKIVVTPAVTA